MEQFLGDLERAFATSLYPNRVPIAIGLVLLAGLIAWLAWRRRWDLVARRHPRRTLLALGLMVALGGPVAWYLGSPIFIRSELSAAGSGGTTLASGQFRGADEFHYGSGTATLVRTGDGDLVVRFTAFSVRNGPDLYVFVSPDPAGYSDAAVELGRLKATDGAFEYELPAGLDPDAAASVVIWCKQFAVQFAVAALTEG